MNRLAWATDGIRTTTYGYAGMGRRVAVTGSVVKLYEVDEARRRLGEYVKDATQLNGWRAVQEFVYLDAWRIVGIADYNASGVFTDMLAVVSDPITGTPRQVIDQDGDVRWDWDAREPFGYQAPNETPTAGKAALVFDARFPGQWSDEVAGTYHNNWREYWPRAGRYTQVDPIGLAGGENPYAYVMGNPVGAVDPEGLDCISGNGFTTCHYPEGPRFTIKTPNGFPQSIQRAHLLYHNYKVERNIGCANPNDVMNKIIKNPTPGKPDPASFSGTPNNATVLGFDNHVTSYLTTDLNTGLPLVVNITGIGSMFGPGYVARMVYDGKALTFGEGTNWKQSAGLLGVSTQEIANEMLWGNQMSQFIEQCGCK